MTLSSSLWLLFAAQYSHSLRLDEARRNELMSRLHGDHRGAAAVILGISSAGDVTAKAAKLANDLIAWNTQNTKRRYMRLA
jgi:hypothetical protein